jgi:hypothetical protein
MKSIRTVMKQRTIMLYAFFWVIPWRPNFIFQRFGTHYLFYLHGRIGMKNNRAYSSYLPVYEDGTDSVFRNVGI